MTTTDTKVKALSKNVSIPTQSVAFQFGNGNEIIANLSDFNDDIVLQLALHGISQKIGDAAAIARNTGNGQSAEIQAKYEACLAMYEQLKAGEWERTRKSSATQADEDLLEAIVRLYGEDKRAAQKEALTKLSAEEKKRIKGHPTIAKHLADILQERANNMTPVDLDALLGVIG